MMILFQTRYRKYLAFMLIMLMAIPCSAKLEIKESLKIESNQPKNNNKTCTTCTIYQELKQVAESEKGLNSRLSDSGLFLSANNLIEPKGIKITDFFKAQKEKIPTYLFIDRLLI